MRFMDTSVRHMPETRNVGCTKGVNRETNKWVQPFPRVRMRLARIAEYKVGVARRPDRGAGLCSGSRRV